MKTKINLRQLSILFNQHKWIGVCFLIVLAFTYSLSALFSPFWVGNDAWSNLLPVVHFRDSILNNHTLPIFTDLWYGGRAQWANPLWSFLYFPATIIQLIIPLDWGVRIVYLGHLIFILLAGRKLASVFFNTEFERITSAIITASPILPAFTAGQNEKIMSWGWVLLAVYFLFNIKLTAPQRGFRSGFCLGVIPLTGSNYYTLYLGILLFFLVSSYKDIKIFTLFFLGSSIGLLHLPSILHLIGQERGNSFTSINELSISIIGLFSSLSIGIAEPIGWETWAPIGIPLVYVFLNSLILQAKAYITKKQVTITTQQKVLLLTLLPFTLLVTGVAYQLIPALKVFRVPSRVLPFIALAAVLFVFIDIADRKTLKFRYYLLSITVLQLCLFSYMIKPYGALYSPYDSQAQHTADILKSDGAKQVWISMENELNNMYIQASFNRNGLGLPNVYYGDMGQLVRIEGSHCGYSFDHLVTMPPSNETQYIELVADMEWSDTKGKIPLSDLNLVQQVNIHNLTYNIYRVVCKTTN